MIKQYAQRDVMALDRQGNHYSRHLNAMTAEGLGSKSEIAAELAWRDARIEELAAQVEGEATVCGAYRDERDALATHMERLYESFKTADTWEDVREVFAEKSEVSLSLTKAKWQAEVLQEVLDRIPGDLDHHGCDFGCGLIVAQMVEKLNQKEKVNV